MQVPMASDESLWSLGTKPQIHPILLKLHNQVTCPPTFLFQNFGHSSHRLDFRFLRHRSNKFASKPCKIISLFTIQLNGGSVIIQLKDHFDFGQYDSLSVQKNCWRFWYQILHQRVGVVWNSRTFNCSQWLRHII